MEPITPGRIIPFATTRDDAKNTLTEMLIVNHARSEQGVDDLVAANEVELTSTYPSLRKNGIPGDFRFIMIHRIYYLEDAANSRQNLLMSLYSIIRKIGIDETKALGLDTSVVVVERVPLIINNRAKNIRRITRVD